MSWLSLLRSILHDPKVFKNPMDFQPERYLKDGMLNPDMLDRDSVGFGYGRRCVYILRFTVTSHWASWLFSAFVREDT